MNAKNVSSFLVFWFFFPLIAKATAAEPPTPLPAQFQKPLSQLTHAVAAVRSRALNELSNQWTSSHGEEGEIPPSSLVNAFRLAARDSEASIRQAAVRFLGQRDWIEAFPAIQDALEDSSLGVRHLAINALGSSTHPEAFPLLLKVAAKGQDTGSRVTAVQWLGQAKNISAIPTLRAALSDPDPSVQRSVIQVFSQFGEVEIAMNVTLALHDTNPHIRLFALQSLNKDLPEASLIPQLTRLWQHDPDPTVRQNTMQYLLLLGDSDLIPFLTEAYRDPSDISRSQIIQGLWRWGEDALPLLFVALRDESSERTSQAILALQNLFTQGKITTPLAQHQVLAALKDWLGQDQALKPPGHLTSVYALLSLMKGPEIFPLLAQEWERGDSTQKDRLIEPFLQMKDGRTLPLLGQALNQGEVQLCRHILSVLPSFGEAAIPYLQDALSKTTPAIGVLILNQLGQLKAHQAVPAIMGVYATSLSKRTLISVRHAAIKALGLIQDPRALPTLREALKDPDVGVRTGAEQALEWMGELENDTFKKRP